MPIRVQDSDSGQTFVFPDDMKPEDMASAIQWHKDDEQVKKNQGYLKDLGIGVAKGAVAVAGLPGDISELMGQGVNYLSNKITGEDTPYEEPGPYFPNSENLQRGVEYLTHAIGLPDWKKPEDETGQMYQTVGEFLAPSPASKIKTLQRVGGKVGSIISPTGAAGQVLKRAPKGWAADTTKTIQRAADVSGAVLGGIGAEEGRRLGEGDEEGEGHEGIGSFLGGLAGSMLAGKATGAWLNARNRSTLKGAEETYQEAKKGYKILDAEGAAKDPQTGKPKHPVSSQDAARLYRGIVNDLFDQSHNWINSKKTLQTLKMFLIGPGGTIPGMVTGARNFSPVQKDLRTLLQLHAHLGEVDQGMGTADERAAWVARDVVREYIEQKFPALSDVAKEARGNWAAYSSLESINKLVEIAQRRAANSGTGANVMNTMRQEIRRFFNNSKSASRMTQEERDQAEKIVLGTWLENSLRFGGRFAPTGLHSSALALGLSLAHPGYGVGMAAGGYLMKKLGDKLTEQEIHKLEQMVMERAPVNKAQSNVARRARKFAKANLGRQTAHGAIIGTHFLDQQDDDQQQSDLPDQDYHDALNFAPETGVDSSAAPFNWQDKLMHMREAITGRRQPTKEQIASGEAQPGFGSAVAEALNYGAMAMPAGPFGPKFGMNEVLPPWADPGAPFKPLQGPKMPKYPNGRPTDLLRNDPEFIAQLPRLLDQGVSLRDIAARFRVSETTIKNIARERGLRLKEDELPPTSTWMLNR